MQARVGSRGQDLISVTLLFAGKALQVVRAKAVRYRAGLSREDAYEDAFGRPVEKLRDCSCDSI